MPVLSLLKALPFPLKALKNTALRYLKLRKPRSFSTPSCLSAAANVFQKIQYISSLMHPPEIRKQSQPSFFSRNPVCLKVNDYTHVEILLLLFQILSDSDMAALCSQDTLRLHRNNHLHMRCNLHLQADIL